MNQFSISDIETLSGIKAHTLRVWEQRYNLLNPSRKESKHRVYSNEDLKYILRVSYLYHKGYKISKIAALSEQDIREKSLQMDAQQQDYDVYINQLTEASIDLDQDKFEEIVHTILLHLGYEAGVLKIFFPLLNRIGLLWMVNSVTPAQEHFASALIIKKMLTAINGLPRKKYLPGDRRVLLFTPQGELHEMPLLYLHYLLKKKEVALINAGKNNSLEVLKEILEVNPVTHLYFHLVTNLLHCPIDQYLQSLSTLFPRHEIHFSGMAACLAPLPPNVHYLRDMQSVTEYVNFL